MMEKDREILVEEGGDGEMAGAAEGVMAGEMMPSEAGEEAVAVLPGELPPINLRDLLRWEVLKDLLKNPVNFTRLRTRDLVVSVGGYNLIKNGAVAWGAAIVAEQAGADHPFLIGATAGVVALFTSASFLAMIGYLGVKPAVKKFIGRGKN